MKKDKRIKKDSTRSHFFYNLVYQLINTVSPLIVTPKLSRVFGVDYLGIKSFTFSIVYYFAVFGVLGLDMYGQRSIALVRDKINDRSEVFWTIFCSKLFLCSCSLIIYLIVINIIAISSFEKIIFYCWTIYLIREMINPAWFLQGMGKYRQLSLLGMTSQIVYVICSFLFIDRKELLPLYVVFFTFIPLIISISYFPIVARSIIRIKIGKNGILKSIRASVIYFIPTVAIAIYSMVDKTMLGFFDITKQNTGLYESAEKLVKVALALSTASFTIMRTRMSYLFANADKTKYEQTAKMFISFSMMLCWPIMFGIIGIAKDFVPLFFGGGFEKVVYLSYIFSMVIPCLTISGLLQAIYIFPYGLQKIMNGYYMIIVTINILMNFLLISILNTEGAVIASILAEMLLGLILFIKARKEIDVLYIIKSSTKYLFASIGMFFVIIYISNTIDTKLLYKVIIEFLIGIITYFLFCLLLKDSFIIDQLKTLLSKSKSNRGDT